LWLKKSIGTGSLSSGSEKKYFSEKEKKIHVIKYIKDIGSELLSITIPKPPHRVDLQRRKYS
jgi:hypothetical protein